MQYSKRWSSRENLVGSHLEYLHFTRNRRLAEWKVCCGLLASYYRIYIGIQWQLYGPGISLNDDNAEKRTPLESSCDQGRTSIKLNQIINYLNVLQFNLTNLIRMIFFIAPTVDRLAISRVVVGLRYSPVEVGLGRRLVEVGSIDDKVGRHIATTRRLAAARRRPINDDVSEQ